MMTDEPDLQTALLKLINSPEYRAAKPKTLAKLLDLPEEHYRDLKRLIKKLTKRGQLSFGPNHLVFPPGKGANQITGVFRRMDAGFGFVRPSGAAPGHDRKQDIFIPAKWAKDAATGDTVLVRLAKKSDYARPNPEGEILDIVQRETHSFVGVYLEEGGLAYVQVDGTLYTQPILVGDPGAKNAQPGDKVVFEMVRFPSHIHDGEGVITEVLGPRGTPGVDTLSIIREFNLPDAFPADVLDAARLEADKFDESTASRLDLTSETVITIDPVDARDFDDAISLSRLDNGHWQLSVHIADVAHFVRPGTTLDREANHRGTSVYLPDRVLPMLPEIISNALASLQPDRVRYTKTAMIEFTADGAPVAAELHHSAIKSKRRFTYEEVDDFLEHRAKWRKKLTPEVFELLERMHELAMILRERRKRRGSLELHMAEVKIDLNKDGRVVGAHKAVQTESHQIIEEFMLAANEAVARRISEREWLFLRRVHMAPDPKKLKLLTNFVRELGYKVEDLESRFELQKLLNEVVGRPEEHAVNYAVLRSLQRAIYSPVDEGHYALASKHYCHFTSPIRRYPDLTIHRLVDAIINGSKPTNDPAELALLGEHCSDRERRAEAAERELTKVKLLEHLRDQIGQEMDAVITGVEDFGLFAQGIELPAEGFIHVTSLSDDYYRFERASHSLTGHRAGNRFRLGDVIRVSVARVDVDRRELDFRLVARKKKAEPRGRIKLGKRSGKPKKGGKPHKGKHGAGDKKRGKRR